MIKMIKGYSKNGELIFWTSNDNPVEGSLGFKRTKKHPFRIDYVYYKQKWNKIKWLRK
jgi:hypothetical protein